MKMKSSNELNVNGFKGVDFAPPFGHRQGDDAFTMSPTRWVEKTIRLVMEW